jgi:hypothetical protein
MINIIPLRGLSPRAEYTYPATAAFRRSWREHFAERECRVVSAADPYGRILGFLDHRSGHKYCS